MRISSVKEHFGNAPIYRCGSSLAYTKSGLIILFIWLLWGDFCLTIMESCRPAIMPLMLRNHSVSNFTIGLLGGSIPALLNFVVNPIISTASDRTRTKYGRRIPYLLFSAPFVTIFLILLGWSEEIGQWLYVSCWGGVGSPALLIVILIGMFSIGYQFFDLFAGCVYYYIFADVVPQQFMGRFIGFFRITGSVAGLCFNLLVMPYIKLHIPLVCTIIGLIYLVGFSGMCLKVKEGDYPPPSPAPPGLWGKIDSYRKDCFNAPFWIILFLGLGFNYASTTCRSLFNLLYAVETLNMTTGQYGQIMAVGSIVSIVLAVPVGYLIDRYHPIRAYIAGAAAVIIVNAFGFYLVHDYPSFFVVSILLSMVYVVQIGARLPLAISLFPKSQFGQFSSACSMIKALMMVAANAGGGWFIDKLGYQYIFVWDLLFTLISFIILCWCYRRWHEYGGDKNYQPPLRDKSPVTEDSAIPT